MKRKVKKAGASACGRPEIPRNESEKFIGLSWIIIAFIAVTVLLINAWSYMPFMSDDAFISLRYAERLIEGKGLTWNDHERVEGYSNLLWVLCTASIGLFRIDLITAARVLGVLGMSASLLAIIYYCRPRDLPSIIAALTVGLSFSLCASIAIWTIGGLEQPLLLGTLAWALILIHALFNEDSPRLWRALLVGVLMGLIGLARADGFVFFLAVGIGMMITGGLSRTKRKATVIVILVPLMMVSGHFIFRRLYYNEWLPNSAYAKVSFSFHRIHAGFHYLTHGLKSLWGLWAPALLSIPMATADRTGRRWIIFLGFIAGCWCCYVMMIGGDVFPGWRHLTPIVPIFCLLTAYVLRWSKTSGKRRWGILLLAAGVIGSWSLLHRNNDLFVRAANERWEWDGQAVGNLLRRAFEKQQPLLACDSAGSLPYFSKLPSIDMLGINDHFLAHHRPPDYGQGELGHELGNGKYVLDRKPDLVIFTLPHGPGPFFRSAAEMAADPRFAQEYERVNFLAEAPHRVLSRIWIKKEQGKIGIKRMVENGVEKRIIIPGYLLAGNANSIAKLDASGKIGMQASPQAPALLNDLPVAPGLWRIEAVLSAPGRDEESPSRQDEAEKITIKISSPERNDMIHAREGEFEVPGPMPQKINITILPNAEIFLYRVDLSTTPRKFVPTLYCGRACGPPRGFRPRALPRRSSATPWSGAAGAHAIRLRMHALATRLVPNLRGAVLSKLVNAFLGMAILTVGFYFRSWWGLIGLVPLITAVVSFCPLYRLVRISTCRSGADTTTEEKTATP